jgi:hypothetical protein
MERIEISGIQHHSIPASEGHCIASAFLILDLGILEG